MLLRPRKFTFKNKHKKRIFNTSKKTKLHYGQFGVQLQQPLFLNAKQVFRFKLILKKSSRRSDNTCRKFWFNAYPHLPLTLKVAGSRMGKGTGKLAGWFALNRPGTILFEMKNLRIGRAHYFSKIVISKLPVRCFILKSTLYKVNFPLYSSRRISYQSFW